jgi:hypothetical protein
MLINDKPHISKTSLRKLYSDGKSMLEIASILSCSVHRIVYWMDKYGLERRNLSQAQYVKANPGGDPFNIKTELNMDEIFLYGLGLGIYLGEGEKTTESKVRVANSNPMIIRIFIRFLLEICQLEKRKLLYQIICFNNSDPEKIKKYWANQLKISPEKFGKIVQIPRQGKGTYKNKSSNGVCILTVASIKLKPWIMSRLTELNDSLDGSVEEQVLGKY